MEKFAAYIDATYNLLHDIGTGDITPDEVVDEVESSGLADIMTSGVKLAEYEDEASDTVRLALIEQATKVAEEIGDPYVFDGLEILEKLAEADPTWLMYADGAIKLYEDALEKIADESAPVASLEDEDEEEDEDVAAGPDEPDADTATNAVVEALTGQETQNPADGSAVPPTPDDVIAAAHDTDPDATMSPTAQDIADQIAASANAAQAAAAGVSSDKMAEITDQLIDEAVDQLMDTAKDVLVGTAQAGTAHSLALVKEAMSTAAQIIAAYADQLDPSEYVDFINEVIDGATDELTATTAAAAPAADAAQAAAAHAQAAADAAQAAATAPTDEEAQAAADAAAAHADAAQDIADQAAGATGA